MDERRRRGEAPRAATTKGYNDRKTIWFDLKGKQRGGKAEAKTTKRRERANLSVVKRTKKKEGVDDEKV